jgi:predicted ATPase
MAELAQAHCARGEIPEAHATLDDAIARSRRNEELWYLAELLRLKGEAALREKPSSEAAEGFFRESLDIASRQQALSWQLRTAASLARMYRDRGNMPAANETLAPIYRRFTEGFASVDLMAAKALVDAGDKRFSPEN